MSPARTEEEWQAEQSEYARAVEHIENTPTDTLLAEGIAAGHVFNGSVCQDKPRGYLWVIWVDSTEPAHFFINLAHNGRLHELPHGWTPTREEAVEAARAKAAALGARVHFGNDYFKAADHVDAGRASWLKRSLDRERRQERAARGVERNKGKRGSNAVEYLYDWSGEKYRIFKRTQQRIYYSRQSEAHPRWLDDGTKFVALTDVDVPYDRTPSNYRAMFSEAGWQRECAARAADAVRRHEEWRQMRRRSWGAAAEEADYRRDHQRDEAEYQRNRRRAGLAPADPADGDDNGRYTVKRCRREMQKHHPDKGGEREQFELWCKRLEVAKATRSRPAD